MSPALLNAGAPFSDSFNPKKGQIFDASPVCSSLGFSGFISNDQIASSFNMNFNGQSGFVSSAEMNAKFEFNSPSTSNLGSEKPTFSSISGLSRPRMVKSRKSQNPRSMGSSGTRKIDPGFNPFRPVSGNLTGVSSRLESEEYDDGMNSKKDLNLKVTSNVEKVGNALVDEIRKLRIENESIGRQSGNDMYESGSSSLSGIQQPSTGDLPSELPDKIYKLNLGGLGSERSNVSGVAFGNVGGSHGVCNVSGSFGASLASELPNELKRLNLKDTGGDGSRNFVFAASGSNSFVFGSNRTKTNFDEPGIASTLPNRIKNLNIADPDKNDGTQKEMNINKNDQTFGSRDARRTESGEVVDTMILDGMEKLKIRGDSKEIRDHGVASDSSSPRTETLGSISKEDSKIPYVAEFLNPIKGRGEHSTGANVAEYQSDMGSGIHDASASSTSSFPYGGFHFQPVRHEFEVPCTDDAQKKEDFAFSCRKEGLRPPYTEFMTPDSKGNLFTGSKLQTGFCAKKGLVKDAKSKGRKAKVTESKSVFLAFGKNITSKENSIQHEPSESYSPMDVSPCRETGDDEQSTREPSLTSENQTSIDSQASPSTDAIDEDLIRATESMDINESNAVNVKHGEAEERASECSESTCAAMASSPVNCVSAVESESFMSASENLDENGENEVESNADSRNSRYFSAASSASSGESSFTFAASSSTQGQASAAMRFNKKKSRMKAGPDIYIPTRNALSDAQFSPIARVSVLPSQMVQGDGAPTTPLKGGKKITSPTSMAVGGNNVGDAKKVISSPTAPARAAQEACEKWRLRGNQAYANGDLEKAEDCYSQGLSCIPQNETSRDCIRALVLCYSNRAAARMSRGRMREALRDCLVAAEKDLNFFRVQLRAANCYLALGEIGDASVLFKKLWQSTDVCVERKIFQEAFEGLQKAQKASEFMDRSAGLLLQRTLADAESALGVIAEALIICPYSEKLLESKAEALFMLRRYEEVIRLCGQTMEAAEKNSSLVVDGQSSSLEASDRSELLKCYSFRIWRYSLIFKSNFYLGKLEEAVDFLEKQEGWRSMVAKFGNETLESFIPQLSTARDLINHKSAGNGAFQAGKHKEAVEHYTAALSFNVESRPFSAVCFANRAAAYQALGQITEAIADCSLAIALDEHYLKAISRRATLFEMIRDYEQAAKDLERLVSLLTKQAEEKSTHSGAYVSMGSVADLRQARQRLYQMEEQARKGIPLNFYLILGVEPSVTAADLKKAYRKAALRHHPDKAGQSLARAEIGDDGLWKEIAEGLYKDADKLFKMIGEAYAVLSDPDKRFQYDIEEETRNGQRKSSSNTSRMHTETSFNTTERGASGRHWREMWRSSADTYSRGFEPTRPGRYF